VRLIFTLMLVEFGNQRVDGVRCSHRYPGFMVASSIQDNSVGAIWDSLRFMELLVYQT